MRRIRAIDLFCGAGGSSWGAQSAGVKIVAGFDMSEYAGEAFCNNFPKAWFYAGRLEWTAARQAADELGRIDMILASPECTHHSVANGKKRRSSKSTETAFHITRFASVLKPRWIVVENVIRMQSWSRYEDFLFRLEALGYRVTQQTLNAAAFGVPQTRRRLFLLCDRKRQPAKLDNSVVEPVPAKEVLDYNGHYRFTQLHTERRAEATIERAERAITSLGKSEPFLLVYYGSDHSYGTPEKGGWQPLDVPLRTITTLDRFAYVKPAKKGHVMRMLQVPELKAAMGMPKEFDVGCGQRRQRIHVIGNAVCPPVIESAVRSLISEQQ